MENYPKFDISLYKYMYDFYLFCIIFAIQSDFKPNSLKLTSLRDFLQSICYHAGLYILSCTCETREPLVYQTSKLSYCDSNWEKIFM